MPYNWEETWNWVKTQHDNVERAAEKLSALMRQGDSPFGAKAAALRDLAEQLCIFLSRCRDAGILDALADEGVEALQSDARGYMLAHLEKVIRQERAVLDLVGMDSKWAMKMQESLRQGLPTALAKDPIEAGAWKKRARAAVDEICNVPTTAIGDIANRIEPLVGKLTKGVRVVRWAVIGISNSLVILKIPEPVTVTKVSKAIAYLLIASDTE